MPEEALSQPTRRRRRALRIAGYTLGAIAFAVVIFLFGTPPGRDFRNLWRNGTIGAVLFPGGNRTYSASNEKNLKAIRTALMLYEESEGQFPAGNGWMDAIENRIAVSDMAGAETHKKLVRPDLSGREGEFGYAINEKAAGKYKGDAGANTILVYESKQTVRNAHGDPTRDREGMAIQVDGTIVNPR